MPDEVESDRARQRADPRAHEPKLERGIRRDRRGVRAGRGGVVRVGGGRTRRRGRRRQGDAMTRAISCVCLTRVRSSSSLIKCKTNWYSTMSACVNSL